MHGKHSWVMCIPLYRNKVCNNGIDSRKCATGWEGMLGKLKSVGKQGDARFKKNGGQRIQMRLRYRWLHGASICTTFDGC
jgi:hypothetical protein